MKVYQLNDSLCDYDLSSFVDFEWVVYDYTIGDYEGSGELAALCKTDGLIYVTGLGHCSCYGPMDDGLKQCSTMTVEEFLADRDDIISYDPGKALKDKVRQLVKRQQQRPAKRKVKV